MDKKEDPHNGAPESDKDDLPAYHDEDSSVAAPLEKQQPPAYDGPSNTSAGSSSSSIPAEKQVYQILHGKNQTWTIVHPSSNQPHYKIVHNPQSAPQLRLLSEVDGSALGSATFSRFSRVAELSLPDSKGDVELRPVDAKGFDYVYSSPALARTLKWHWTGMSGLGGMKCTDERGDEVAKWEVARFSIKKVAKLELARWLDGLGGKAESAKREIVLVGAVMATMQRMVAEGKMLGPMQGGGVGFMIAGTV